MDNNETHGNTGNNAHIPRGNINFNGNTSNNTNFPRGYKGTDGNNGNNNLCSPLFDTNCHPGVCFESFTGGQHGIDNYPAWMSRQRTNQSNDGLCPGFSLKTD